MPAGTEVTWAFKDGPVPHNVVGQGWGSEEPRRSGTFGQPGTYHYTCTLHPEMSVLVEVTAPS